MDGIGEVHRCRPARQRDDRPFRREAEHLVLEHLELGVLQKLLRIVGVLENVEQLAHPAVLAAFDLRAVLRSEEHTSELQSLMRISYAVFCLKKKKKQKPHINR